MQQSEQSNTLAIEEKDQRVIALASEIVRVLRQHTRHHEAFDALDMAKILFRPVILPRKSYEEHLAEILSEAQSHPDA